MEEFTEALSVVAKGYDLGFQIESESKLKS